uniref:Uncharacterized protein n=1 Tax=Rhodosorus marinus TaxID=101924 RepID=A0A7S2ZAF8_9RHOD
MKSPDHFKVFNSFWSEREPIGSGWQGHSGWERPVLNGGSRGSCPRKQNVLQPTFSAAPSLEHENPTFSEAQRVEQHKPSQRLVGLARSSLTVSGSSIVLKSCPD